MNIVNRIYSTVRAYGLSGLVQKLQLRLESYVSGSDQTRINEKYTPDAAALETIRSHCFARHIRISIIVPVFNPSLLYLEKCIASVFAQTYQHWELCLVDDCSTQPGVREYLESIATRDPRVRLFLSEENGHIAQASNHGLQIASGEFVAFLDQDDELAPHALYAVMNLLQKNPATDIIYSNEDKITVHDRRFDPTFKPEWSREYALSFMYVGHHLVYRKSLVDFLGGFRTGYDGAQDYDLLLRATEHTDSVKHIPEILYHWRSHAGSVAGNKSCKDYAYTAGENVLNDSFKRVSVPLKVSEHSFFKGIYQHHITTDSGDTSEYVLAYFGAGTDWDVFFKKKQQPTTYKEYFFCIGAPESNKNNLIPVPDVAGMIYNITHSAPAHTTKIIFIDIRFGRTPDKQALSLATALYLPAVYAAIPKISCRNKILIGGVSVCQREIIHHFYGVNTNYAGYGARLQSIHNCSLIPPYIVAFKKGFLESLSLSTIEGLEPYPAFTVISIAVQSAGGRIVWNPCSHIKSSTICIPEKVVIDFNCQPWTACEKQLSSLPETDPFYPVGLDTNKRNFRVAL